jgi:hypothetical protein
MRSTDRVSPVDLVLTPQRHGPIDRRRDILVGQSKASHRSLHHGSAELSRKRQPELELGAAAKSLFLGAIPPVAGPHHPVHPRVHPFVNYRRGHRSGRYVSPVEKRQLRYAGTLVGKVRSATGESHNQKTAQVTPEMKQPPGLVLLDQSQRLVQSLKYVGCRNVRPRVLDDYGEAA